MYFEIIEGFEICCKDCLKDFWICRRCYRGHKYCSAPCRKVGRKKGQKISKLEYESSPEAKGDHRDRQKAYRKRLKEKLENIAACVTEQCIAEKEVTVQASSELDPAICHYCKVRRFHTEEVLHVEGSKFGLKTESIDFSGRNDF